MEPWSPPPGARVFEVTLDPSGRAFSAGPGESVLDAALRQGVPLPYGCRNGTCGACRARVLAGEVRLAPGDGEGSGAAAAAPPRGLTAREAAAGWTLLCRARAGSDVRLAARADDAAPAVRTLPARIASKRLLAHDVMELRLRLPPTERLQYRAGQYVHLLLPDGRRRAFSLANCPACDELLELHVRRVPDGFFSGRLFDGPSGGPSCGPSGGLSEGALVRLEGPLGGFHLRAGAGAGRPAVLLAGGTGFAPVKSIIENALLDGPLGREMHLYRGVRALRDLYLPELPREWARDHPPLRYVPVLSEPAPEDGWSGRTGLVHEAVLADFPDLSGCEVYASGPPPMVRAVRERFPERGLDAERLFFDSFDHAYETGHDG